MTEESKDNVETESRQDRIQKFKQKVSLDVEITPEDKEIYAQHGFDAVLAVHKRHTEEQFDSEIEERLHRLRQQFHSRSILQHPHFMRIMLLCASAWVCCLVLLCFVVWMFRYPLSRFANTLAAIGMRNAT